MGQLYVVELTTKWVTFMLLLTRGKATEHDTMTIYRPSRLKCETQKIELNRIVLLYPASILAIHYPRLLRMQLQTAFFEPCWPVFSIVSANILGLFPSHRSYIFIEKCNYLTIFILLFHLFYSSNELSFIYVFLTFNGDSFFNGYVIGD